MNGSDTDRTGLRILVVDDDAAQRQMLGAVLSAARHRVTAVGNAAAARAAVVDGCDIALVDVSLDGDDGLALAAALAGLSPGLGVIASTGHSRPARLPAGVDAWLEKPYSIGELMTTVAAVASRLQRLAVDDQDRTGRIDRP